MSDFQLTLETNLLEEGKPHIWMLHLGNLVDNYATFFAFLSDDELKKAERYRFQKDRSTFVIVRGALRMLLGHYLNIDPVSLIFEYSNYGKPILSKQKQDLHFNVSHAKKMAIIGVNWNVPIGVDIEYVKKTNDLDLVARRYFSAKEYHNYMSLEGQEKLVGFYNCWTRKEAFIKAIGHGLSFPLDQFEVSLNPGEEARLLSTCFNEKEKALWSLFSLEIDKNYVAAFATRQITAGHKRFILSGHLN